MPSCHTKSHNALHLLYTLALILLSANGANISYSDGGLVSVIVAKSYIGKPWKVSDSGFHTKSKSHFKIILNGDMKIILDLIDDKIIDKMNETEYEYIPIVNKTEEGYYINIYINNINLEKSKYIVDTYIQLKFKLINNKLIPRLYTYHLKYN